MNEDSLSQKFTHMAIEKSNQSGLRIAQDKKFNRIKSFFLGKSHFDFFNHPFNRIKDIKPL